MNDNDENKITTNSDSKQSSEQVVGADQKNARRALLKNTLIGGGAVISTGLVADKWAKPILNAVILPSHAQTSTAPVVMGGGGGILTASIDSGFDAGDVLGLFVSEAQAVIYVLLQGGCLVLTVDGTVATVELTLNNNEKDTKTGTVSGTSVTVSGLHSDYTVNGTLNSASNPTSCSGTVSGAGESGVFTVSSATPVCAPVTQPTTTATPTLDPNANVRFAFSLAKSYWS